MTGLKAAVAVLAAALSPMAPAAADPGPPPPVVPVPVVPAPIVPVPAAPGVLPAEAPGPLVPAAPGEFLPQQARISNPLGQVGADGGPLGIPKLPIAEMLLGQRPAAPGPLAAGPGAPPAPVAIPSLSATNPDYLLNLNVAPAPPGQGTLAPGIGPNEDVGGMGRIALLRRIYAMYDAGLLKGALLGQNPLGELPPPPTG